ncbi:MAG: hypothetical protein IH973_12915, partial [Myxococcales bacterium]|nr:hypothetical protein [Myxococcales bacterium]
MAAARSGELEVEAGLISLLLEAVDTARVMAADALEGQDEESLVAAEMHERIQAHLQAGNVTTAPQVAAQPAAELHEASRTPDVAQTLRVRVDLLDRLLNLAGEIAIGRGGMAERLLGDLAPSTEELLEIHQELDRDGRVRLEARGESGNEIGFFLRYVFFEGQRLLNRLVGLKSTLAVHGHIEVGSER